MNPPGMHYSQFFVEWNQFHVQLFDSFGNIVTEPVLIYHNRIPEYHRAYDWRKQKLTSLKSIILNFDQIVNCSTFEDSPKQNVQEESPPEISQIQGLSGVLKDVIEVQLDRIDLKVSISEDKSLLLRLIPKFLSSAKSVIIILLK